MPAISIVMPVYNAERFLARSVDSVLAQTFTDFELLLIDDGSSDSSPNLCDAYAKKDARIKAFHKENGGTSSARNMGIELAEGDYIGFMDNDDYIFPYAYEKLYEKVVAADADVVKCGFVLIDDDDFLPPYPIDEKDVKSQYVPYSYDGSFLTSKQYLGDIIQKRADAAIWNMLVKRDICKQLRFWDRYFEDWEFHSKLAMLVQGYATIPEHGYVYIQRKESQLYNKTISDSLDISFFSMIFSKQLAELGLNEDSFRAVRNSYTSYLKCLEGISKLPPERLRDMMELTAFFQEYMAK